ncbi:heavy metal-associated domain-containing protein [uncultured Algibacter sp.]|uniref:heavy-metal-associated domain-containing protein n=1 Tax=uncultured Algibacter sp. TaxID=298659 RepID=UPI0026386754|nr:heavy metal-associated domain-containing protein [uncultured Algibacter sp.]
MKTFRNIISIMVLTLFLVNCKNEAKPVIKTVETETAAVKELDPNASYAKAEFTIDGMTCEIGCAKTIEKKISKMEGVKSATVDFGRKLAMVEYNEAKVTTASLENTVTNVADVYKVSNMQTVDSFSTSKSCDKECCAGKTDEEKANCKKACCANKTDAEKKACAADCKKECCAKKA